MLKQADLSYEKFTLFLLGLRFRFSGQKLIMYSVIFHPILIQLKIKMNQTEMN